MSLSWDRAYARHKSAEREMHRRIANDPAIQAKSSRYAKRFGAACKQTRGNIKATVALMAEWDEAAERERNSPVRTLALAENGEPEPFEHEDDLS